MSKPLRILFVEDSLDDFELVLRQLRADGLVPDAVRVDSLADFQAALGRGGWDAIVSDYNLTTFTAVDTLAAVRERAIDLPFIVVTGSIGEDRAVDLMRRGAHDFVLKGDLSRLGAAVERAVGDARIRHERRQAIDALHTTNQELSTLVSAAPLAIIAIGQDGQVRGWNTAAVRLLGWPSEEVVGRPVPALDGDASPLFSILCGRVRGGRTLTAVETNLRHRDGHLVGVSLSMAPLGAGGGCLAIAEDITERRRLEDMLLQSQKLEAIGLLAGGVAHDFNNILGVILGYGDRLLSKTPVDDLRRRAVEEICKAAERAGALTRQLLAFSRKQTLTMEVVDLNEIVRRTEGMLGRLIGEDITLLAELHAGPLPVLCDPGQIEVVIMNLVVNARDAMPGGGRLTIGTAMVRDEPGMPEAPGGTCAVLTVSDTGTGMDDATRARIFEPFFTTKERGRGTGLGLSMVFGVVQQSGGDIAVDSVLGRGTTFRIHLPLTRMALTAGEVVDAAAGGDETILLVEDESGLRAIIEDLLRGHGYSVLSAESPEEALELHRLNPRTDLLLTDVVMPGMSGVALAGRLLAATPGLRVVYMSGYTDDAILRHGVSIDDMLLIEKPFRSEALLSLIRRALDAQQQPESGG